MRRDGELPDLLTVEEAAALLRVGRTKAYAMAKEWRATEGRSGLPVLDFGNVLRVPRCRLEAMVGGELRATASRPRQGGGEPSGDSDGSRQETPGGTAVVEAERTPEAPGGGKARTGGEERRGRRRSGPGAAQLSLLHPPSTPDPTTHLATPPSHPTSTNSTTLP